MSQVGEVGVLDLLHPSSSELSKQSMTPSQIDPTGILWSASQDSVTGEKCKKMNQQTISFLL